MYKRQIQQEAAQAAYRQEFGRLGVQMSESLTPDEWAELYRRLVFWELELDTADRAMAGGRLRQWYRDLLAVRTPVYSRADIRFDTTELDDAAAISDAVRRFATLIAPSP